MLIACRICLCNKSCNLYNNHSNAEEADIKQGKRHIIIGGTGRAGTSFLVKYFDAVGFETHLKNGPDDWDDTAEAGLEDMPLGANQENLPYVIKTPWLYQIIDQLLGDGKIKVDLVILPMRELMEAASSRAVLEYQAMHRKSKRHADFTKTWDASGSTKGGIVYSLHPLDEARILAMGFHDLVEKLVEKEIPIAFLSFPKFIDDPDYLYRSLKPFLKDKLSKERSDLAHSKLVDTKKVRVSREIKDSDKDNDQLGVAEVENIALKRELAQLRDELTKLQTELDRNNEAKNKKEVLLADLTNKVSSLEKELGVLKNSKSWKITKPIRNVRSRLHKISKHD